MRTLAAVLAAVLALLSPALLALSHPAAAAEPLALKDALRQALAHHPDLVAAGYEVDAAQADVVAARGVLDPTLSASSTLSHAESSGFLAGSALSSTSQSWTSSASLAGESSFGTGWSLSTRLDHDRSTTLSALTGGAGAQEQDAWAADLALELRQDLLAPVRTSAARQGIQAGLAQLDLAELSLRQAQERALAETADAWWDWWQAHEALRLAEDTETAAQAVAAVTRTWFGEGEATALEAAQAGASLYAAQADRVRAEARVRAAADTLLLALGREPGSAIELDPRSTVAIAGAPPTDEELLAGNLDIALARRRLEALDRQRAWAGDGLMPTLDLVVGAGLASLQDSPGAAASALVGEDALPQASAGLELSLPLGNRGARGQRDRAAVELDQARAEVAATTRMVRAELRAAEDALRTAWQGVGLAEARVELAREAEDLEQARLKEGTRRVDQVLDAIEDRQAAQADLLTAQGELATAGLVLVKLRGGLVDLATSTSAEDGQDAR